MKYLNQLLRIAILFLYSTIIYCSENNIKRIQTQAIPSFCSDLWLAGGFALRNNTINFTIPITTPSTLLENIKSRILKQDIDELHITLEQPLTTDPITLNQQARNTITNQLENKLTITFNKEYILWESGLWTPNGQPSALNSCTMSLRDDRQISTLFDLSALELPNNNARWFFCVNYSIRVRIAPDNDTIPLQITQPNFLHGQISLIPIDRCPQPSTYSPVMEFEFEADFGYQWV